MTELAAEVKLVYPSIRNVVRLKNKLGSDTHLVKIELTSPAERSKILEGKRITYNYVSYLVTDYLAPANVLMCSKCCGLGHFRKQCTEAAETCRKCGLSFPDFKNHICAAATCCKHCGGDHPANSMKCPIVRAFRADLTRKLLSKNIHHVNNIEHMPIPPPLMAHPPPGRPPRVNPWSNSISNRPSPQNPWTMTNPSNTVERTTILKLDNLATGFAKIHDVLNKVCESNARLEAVVTEQNTRIHSIESEVAILKEKNGILEAELTTVNSSATTTSLAIKNVAMLVKQTILPIIGDVLLFLGTLNKGATGRVADADLKSRFERYRAQVIKTSEGSPVSS